MYFHRGSWIPNTGIQTASDLFNSNDSGYGTSTMRGQATTSWQKFDPDKEDMFYGYDCSSFARKAAESAKGRKPVIVEFQISDPETYQKYCQYFKLVLSRGNEHNITQDTSLITAHAVLVDASNFTYDEFTKCKGELLIDNRLYQNE